MRRLHALALRPAAGALIRPRRRAVGPTQPRRAVCSRRGAAAPVRGLGRAARRELIRRARRWRDGRLETDALRRWLESLPEPAEASWRASRLEKVLEYGLPAHIADWERVLHRPRDGLLRLLARGDADLPPWSFALVARREPLRFEAEHDLDAIEGLYWLVDPARRALVPIRDLQEPRRREELLILADDPAAALDWRVDARPDTPARRALFGSTPPLVDGAPMFPATTAPSAGGTPWPTCPARSTSSGGALATEPSPASDYVAYSDAAGPFEERDGEPTPYATFLEQVRAAGRALVDHLQRSLERGHSLQVTAAPPRWP